MPLLNVGDDGGGSDKRCVGRWKGQARMGLIRVVLVDNGGGEWRGRLHQRHTGRPGRSH